MKAPGEASEATIRPPLDRAAWRAKRDAKRERQRAESVVRANEMHGARIAAKVAAGPSALQVPSRGESPAGNVFVGCSGWFYWHWRERFYPEGTPTSRWFEHYSKTFQTVELNAPFYSWPKVATVNGWFRQVGRRKFTYTVKVSELITHVKRFIGTARLIEDFYHVADVLGPRMGCFLFQLPPSYRYTKPRLNAIVKQLDQGRRNVVEFRHKGWWNETVYAAFRKKGIIFCSCSGPRLPDELVKTADEVYVRFHGTTRWYRHDYTKEELAVWSERIHASGATKAWAYFNNDRDGYAITNAKELIRQLTRKSRKRGDGSAAREKGRTPARGRRGVAVPG